MRLLHVLSDNCRVDGHVDTQEPTGTGQEPTKLHQEPKTAENVLQYL